MGFNEILSSIFGNKSTRDMKEIKPWVEKIKAAYPEIEALDNDALRAKTEELKKYIYESAANERAGRSVRRGACHQRRQALHQRLFAGIRLQRYLRRGLGQRFTVRHHSGGHHLRRFKNRCDVSEHDEPDSDGVCQRHSGIGRYLCFRAAFDPGLDRRGPQTEEGRTQPC